MNNDLTNVYEVIKREFKDELAYFRLEKNDELKAFLHYNVHNEMFIGTDEVYYHNVYFKNLDDGKKSRMFREGKLYFFPEKDIIEPNSDFIAFSIGKGTKSIRVNGNGLFIEINDLNGNIETYYYDNAALLEISKEGYSAGSIDYIEENIKRKGINPDRIIKTNKNSFHPHSN